MPQAYFTSVAMATNIDGLRIKTKGLELNDRLQFSIKTVTTKYHIIKAHIIWNDCVLLENSGLVRPLIPTLLFVQMFHLIYSLVPFMSNVDTPSLT